MDDQVAPVTDWLRSRNPGLDEIPEDLDLIEQRVIDSLGFMEFVLLLEDLAGREFTREEMDVERFRTLRAIRENFLAPDGDSARSPA